MDNLKKWQIYFGSHRHPICITDVDNNVCYYCNEEFFRVYEVPREVIGNRLHDYLPREEYHLENGLPDWSKQDIFETETFNKRLNQRFLTRTVLEKIDHVFICETIPTENNLTQNFAFEEAMNRCMDIYSHSQENPLPPFMELLCEFYEAECGFVCHYNQKKNSIKCVAYHCANREMSSSQWKDMEIPSKLLLKCGKEEGFSGIMSAASDHPDISNLSELYEILNTYHMKNTVISTIEDGNHNIVGLVGVSNQADHTKYFDRRLITTISRFVSQDMSKRTLDHTLFHVENRDALTGLYNRTAYDKKITQLSETPPNKLGVLSVNINGLKNINNNLGNLAGDEHIKKSGLTVKDHFAYDVFRVSGDEFIALAYEVEEEEFHNKVSALQHTLRDENNYDFSMGSSWGTGKYSYVNLLRQADSVMYINKQEYYATGLRTLNSVSSVILRDLLNFLENDEFMIYLQPQVRLEDGSLHGAEALIRRFDKKNQKMVFPDQFISMYEQASVIRHVDLFVVDTVCNLLSKWNKIQKAIPISVNLSRVTLQEFGIVDTIVKICDKYQVDHSLVVIEVTERVGLIENNVPSALVNDFINNGFAISLDDFGCAYSNIVTLAQIEVDEVKIDKSLVDNLTTNRKNHILVKNVLSMCEELEGMSTLAEGIEDEKQSSLLHELGCHLGQGYFYSRPVPVDVFEKEYIIAGG